MTLDRITIEKAENGFEICACYKKPAKKDNDDGGPMCSGYEEKKFVAASVRDLMDRIGTIVKSPESEMADYMDEESTGDEPEEIEE